MKSNMLRTVGVVLMMFVGMLVTDAQVPVLVDQAQLKYVSELQELDREEIQDFLLQGSDQEFVAGTASAGGNYTKAWQVMFSSLGNRFPQSVIITTRGSVETAEFFKAGYFHAAIIQGDVMADRDLVEAAAKELYRETMFAFVLRTNPLKDLKDIKSGTRIGVGASGSGTEWTWMNLAKAHKKYQDVVLVNLNSSSDWLSALESGRVDVVFAVTGIRNSAIDMLSKSGLVRVLPITETAFTKKIVDTRKKPVYQEIEVPVSATANGQGVFVQYHKDAMKSKQVKSVQTISTGAFLIVNSTWSGSHSRLYEALMNSALVASSQLKASMGQ